MNQLFRYQDTQYAAPVNEFDEPCGEGRLEVKLYAYPVVSTTPKGAWIYVSFNRKFVNLTARKRFACPTIEEAKQSFIARKKAQARILSARLARAQKALAFPLDENPIDMSRIFPCDFGVEFGLKH